MKMIVFVALLAAAGCSKKAASDCDASIAKGMDSFEAAVKASMSNPQMQENRMTMLTKLRGTLTQRCNEDKWPAEVVTCFTTVASMKDMQACQAKLSEEQRTKLIAEIRQVMMSSMGSMRMPNGVPGHPPALAPGGSGAPEPTGGATGGAPGAAAGSAAPPAGAAAAPTSPAPAGSAAGSAAGSGGGW